MKLLVTTPLSILLDVGGIQYVRAEDRTGSFGIQPRHADFLTVLAVSVLSYRDKEGVERHVAVRGGVLRVRGGEFIEVATSDALMGDDLDVLSAQVRAKYHAESEAEARARTRAQKLHLLAMRTIHRYVRGEHEPSLHLPLGTRDAGEGP